MVFNLQNKFVLPLGILLFTPCFLKQYLLAENIYIFL